MLSILVINGYLFNFFQRLIEVFHFGTRQLVAEQFVA